MATVKCYSCRGTKKLLGMGGMIKDCTTCQGIGYIKSDESVTLEPVKPFNTTPKLIDIPKKKGRPFGKPKSPIDILNV